MCHVFTRKNQSDCQIRRVGDVPVCLFNGNENGLYSAEPFFIKGFTSSFKSGKLVSDQLFVKVSTTAF
uniref:Uncharacterized protein n=1 Tax=Anguilla anguilla TaxID=7936 RepID=A0A0E9VWV5_ANGAN